MPNQGQLAQEFGAGGRKETLNTFIECVRDVCSNFQARMQNAGIDIQAEAFIRNPAFPPEAQVAFIKVTKSDSRLLSFHIQEQSNHFDIVYKPGRIDSEIFSTSSKEGPVLSMEKPYDGGEYVKGGMGELAKRLNSLLEFKALEPRERAKLFQFTNSKALNF
jgi:hypothetical protein